MQKSKFPSYAECNHQDTRQSWEVCRVLWSLHSAKAGRLCRVLSPLHSAKAGRLCRVPPVRHSAKPPYLCRVPHVRHSAKPPCFFRVRHSGKRAGFAECPPREVLCKATVTVNWRRQATFLCRVVYGHSAKPLPSARQKTLGKEAFAVTGFAE